MSTTKKINQTTFSNVSKKNDIFYNDTNITIYGNNPSYNNHQNETITEKRAIFGQKRADIFSCDWCAYKTDKKYNYIRHVRSDKHKKKFSGKKPDCKSKNNNEFICIQCGKKYESRSGLWKHIKKTHDSHDENMFNTSQNQTYYNDNKNQNINGGRVGHNVVNGQKNQNTGILDMNNGDRLKISSLGQEDKHNVYNIINTLILENRELHETLIAQNENLSRENIQLQNRMIEIANQPRTIINQQNNTINILNYLKNECKDAMNLSEFIDTLHITFDDLLHLKEHGISNSIKKTFIQQLQDLDAKRRPIHCSDKKRKKFFVKEDDDWKRDEENKEIQKALRYVSMKQIETLQCWKQSNPNWLDDDNKLLNVNAITCEISKIYDSKENKKIINNLSQLGVGGLQLSLS